MEGKAIVNEMPLNTKRDKSKETTDLKYKEKISTRARISAWVSRIIIVIMCLIVLFPVFAVVTASMSKGQVFIQKSLLPASWSFENYVKVIQDTNYLIWLKNSLIVCTAVSVIQLLLTIPAAFSFSKLKFKLKNKGLLALIVLQMFPATMALPAILAVAYRINGMDNFLVLILIQCAGSAYNIWLMKGYIDGIPDELVEAAYVDGATTFQTFVKIIFPLMKSMIAVIFLFSFIGAYSEFFFTSALMKQPGNFTLATGMRTFIKDKFSSNWTQYSAAAVMSSVPLVILFLLSQRFISKGLVAGAVKG